MIKKVNITEVFATITQYWNPKIGGDINESQIKFAKFKGAFNWHHHENEDELFLVVKGILKMQFRPEDGGDVIVNEGEYVIVPKKVEHCPEALTPEVHCILLEPFSTLNTGNVINELTRSELKRI
jgi:mannose-6-phosphate isomerase-like protein (cupin superfamily)